MAIGSIRIVGTFVPASRDGLIANQAIAGFALQDPTGPAALVSHSLCPIGYDVRATFNTTDATANEVAVSLTARGMTLPAAGQIRALYADIYMRTAASATDFGWLRVVGAVMGGATNPILAASAVNIDVQVGITAATAAFSINTPPTPDELVLNVTGVAATSINWDARIYCGPLVVIP